MANDKPTVESDEAKATSDRPKYISDEERRATEINLSAEEAAKYLVTEATPSSGGVFPPSAVVTPFSADVIAAHTPGDEGREKLRLEQEKAAGEKPAEETTPTEAKDLAVS